MQLQTVPAVSVLFMIITLFLSIGFPIILCIVFHIKTKAKISCFFVGCLTFIIFARILEAIMHYIVLRQTGSLITGHIFIYALYGGLAAAAFEETGRYVAMKTLLNRSLTRENAFMYGIGHGGVEAILLVGLSYIGMTGNAIMINNGSMANILAALSGTLQTATYNNLSSLWTTPSYIFLLAGIERFLTIIFHISMSILVYEAVKNRRKSFYWIAFGLHFLSDFSGVMIAKGVSPILEEVFLLLYVAVIVFFVCRIYKKDPTLQPEP